MKLNRLVLIAALLLAVTACRHHGAAQRPVRQALDPALLKLPKEDVYQKGEDFFVKKRYQKARTYFGFVYENYPNDPLGRRALLRVADSYFAQGDAVNLVAESARSPSARCARRCGARHCSARHG